MSETRLIKAASNVWRYAHDLYSKFSVGAAVLTKSGKLFLGCNVENVSLRLTICTEQAAVAAAVANGDVDFLAIAVVADPKHAVVPCGACRQVLAEFNPAIWVITSTINGRTQTFLQNELLPRPTQGILESFRNV